MTNQPQAREPSPHEPYPQDSGHSTPAAPPSPLATAVKLMYAGAALAVVGIIVSFTQVDAVREQLVAEGLPPALIDSAVTLGMVTGVVVGLIGVALWIVNAVFNAKGRKWARILSTVLAGLALLSFLFSFTQPRSTLALLLGVVQVLLAAAIVWLLWRPESSRYYDAMSAPPTH